MIQFQILSGKQAGVFWNARRFPVRIGRASGSDLRLDDDGVWEEHFQLSLNPAEGFAVTVHPGAIVTVNQAPVQTARLRNGDIITAGSAKLCFRIADNRQRGLRLREWFVWTLIVTVCLSQVALIYWLLQQ
ncbi:MAG TPA: FHA domain-containing protein [Verrucomicrobiae bacterium]|nr:FHA domain-containing protein [Verrucomicrobiae bacterium]